MINERDIERWYPVKEFPDKEVSNYGRLRKKSTKHIYKPRPDNRYTYTIYVLKVNGITKYIPIEIIMLNNITKVESDHYIKGVEYKNGDRNDLYIDNLIPIYTKARKDDEWVKIQGYDILIASTGELRHSKSGRILIPTMHKNNGLIYVSKDSCLSIPKIVYLIFGLGLNLYDEEYNKYFKLIFKDGDKTNPDINNLILDNEDLIIRKSNYYDDIKRYCEYKCIMYRGEESWYDIPLQELSEYKISNYGRLKNKIANEIKRDLERKTSITYLFMINGEKIYYNATYLMCISIPNLIKKNKYVSDKVTFINGCPLDTHILNIIPNYSIANIDDDWVKVDGFDIIISSKGDTVHSKTKKLLCPISINGSYDIVQNKKTLNITKAVYVLFKMKKKLSDIGNKSLYLKHKDGDKRNLDVSNIYSSLRGVSL